jgi:hypothetical protein
MKDPTLYGGIDKKSDYTPSYPPSMEVHHSCGIPDKVCHLIADGDTFNQITVAPLSSDNPTSMGLAADLFYEAINFLPWSCDFGCLHYALTQAAENLDFLESQKQSVDDACEAVEIKPGSSFVINTATGRPLARFTEDGDLVMYAGAGTIHTQSSPENLASSDCEFIVKNVDSNVVRLAHDTGELYIAGNLYTNKTSFTEPASAVKVKSGDTLVAFITGTAYADSALEPGESHTVPAGSIVLTGNVR